MEKKSVLVIGASGFLGSVLCEELLEDNYRVIGIGRKEKGFLSEECLNNKNFIYLKSKLEEIDEDQLKKYKIFTIFQLASLVEYASSDYSDYSENTIKITLKTIEMAKFIGASQIVYSSTLGVITKPHLQIDENTEISPNSNYGLAKYTCEKLLEFEAVKNKKLKMICFRFPALFGKNHKGGIVHTLKEHALKNEDIELYDKGVYKRNIMYSKDAAKVMILANKRIDELKEYELFVIGSKNSLSLFSIAENILKLTKSDSKLLLSEKKSPNSFDSVLNLSKAKKLLDFEPMSIQEGLEKYIRELR